MAALAPLSLYFLFYRFEENKAKEKRFDKTYGLILVAGAQNEPRCPIRGRFHSQALRTFSRRRTILAVLFFVACVPLQQIPY